MFWAKRYYYPNQGDAQMQLTPPDEGQWGVAEIKQHESGFVGVIWVRMQGSDDAHPPKDELN